jgi:hypothetical protein
MRRTAAGMWLKSKNPASKVVRREREDQWRLLARTCLRSSIKKHDITNHTEAEEDRREPNRFDEV